MCKCVGIPLGRRYSRNVYPPPPSPQSKNGSMCEVAGKGNGTAPVGNLGMYGNARGIGTKTCEGSHVGGEGRQHVEEVGARAPPSQVGISQQYPGRIVGELQAKCPSGQAGGNVCGNRQVNRRGNGNWSTAIVNGKGAGGMCKVNAGKVTRQAVRGVGSPPVKWKCKTVNGVVACTARQAGNKRKGNGVASGSLLHQRKSPHKYHHQQQCSFRVAG